MDGLAKLLSTLEARHSKFFAKSWDSLSIDAAKGFTQIERDIISVNAALGRPEPTFSPDLQVVLERLAVTEISAPKGESGPARNHGTQQPRERRSPHRQS